MVLTFDASNVKTRNNQILLLKTPKPYKTTPILVCLGLPFFILYSVHIKIKQVYFNAHLRKVLGINWQQFMEQQKLLQQQKGGKRRKKTTKERLKSKHGVKV